MTSLFDEIVITDGNREAFERIWHITDAHEGMVSLFIWGPSGSGKSTIAHARGRERDLLSTRRVISCHAAELRASLESGVNDGFLDAVGEADALILDGFESLFCDGVGQELARLLLTERNRRGLDTVVISDVALFDLDLADARDALVGYEIIEVEPLDEEGFELFAHRVHDRLQSGRDDAPIISDEALSFIAGPFRESPDDIRNAVRYLVTRSGEEAGSVITLSQAKELLGYSS